ncbi:hypothetical protein [Natroniella sp. ANB-PHB2]|uniref:hypothetical protein n=1 Tax=Natroniella sp. ANB-PHB2 TaxID=3384444 RepID=UPI0038D43626
MLRKEYVKSMQEAFDDYLEDGGPAYVPKYKLKPEDVIELIHNADGKAILAHPGIIEDDNIVKSLIFNREIDGIEAYYSSHSEEETKKYIELANDDDLIITGGSDCHGPKNKDKYLIGSVNVPYELLTNLKS